MSIKKTITEQELSEVKYQDLLATFKSLGVEDSWKPGKKKTAMIKDAIEKLNIVRSLEDKGISEDKITEERLKIEDAKEQAKQVEVAKAIEDQEKADQLQKKTIIKSKYTKEQLEVNLRNIKLNLLQAIPSQRTMLIKKQEVLQNLLDNI